MDYVAKALEAINNPQDHVWRAHGNGFIKTYLDPEETVRLNLWHSRFFREDVSHLHNHPWSFSSQIIIGELRNTRFASSREGSPWMEGRINCQDFRGIEGTPAQVYLKAITDEVYRDRDIYTQRHDEIHETRATDGTATLMTRYSAPSAGFASVYWPVHEEYGDASYKGILSRREIEETISCTKDLLFKSASSI